jgi:hypothetical protein
MDDEWQQLELPANSFSFMFLGNILVTYHNPKCKDTFGSNGVSPSKFIVVDAGGNSQIFNQATLNSDFAIKIRERRVKKIDIELE